MRDEYLRHGPRDHDGPQRNSHDESVDLVARERHESREEPDRCECVRGQHHETHRRPERAADAESERYRIPDDRRAAELIDEGVVTGQVGDARERSWKDVERYAEGDRAHEREREDGPLERA